MADQLKRCPVCKSVAGDFDHGQRYWCECINCGVRGAETGDRHTANEEWNRLASLSSSQQVMNCRPECSGTYWAMEINAAREEGLEESARIADSEVGNLAMLTSNPPKSAAAFAIAGRIRALKSTPASPSQPSSVAMTDEQILNVHANLWPEFTLTHGEKKAVLKFSRALLQSSPKGASTGMESRLMDLVRCYGAVEDNAEILARLSSPQEASKPQDERDNCKFCLGAKGGEPGNENNFNGVSVCDYCHTLLDRVRPLAALTGAAPADANVGEDRKFSNALLFHMGLQGMSLTKAQCKDIAAFCDNFPTAPEPSAPADKDAERYRWLISGHTLSELEDAARAGQQPRMIPQMEIIAHLATWYNCQEDKREIDTMIDAAIDRMRSESGGSNV